MAIKWWCVCALWVVTVRSQYLENIKVVDEGIERITNMFEDVFNNDGKTAYVFTSDHGMTNWGMI